jgi:hypothetical protein
MQIDRSCPRCPLFAELMARRVLARFSGEFGKFDTRSSKALLFQSSKPQQHISWNWMACITATESQSSRPSMPTFSLTNDELRNRKYELAVK